jgi:hypothetical protein
VAIHVGIGGVQHLDDEVGERGLLQRGVESVD